MTLTTTVDNRLTHFKTRAAKGLARVIRQKLENCQRGGRGLERTKIISLQMFNTLQLKTCSCTRDCN